MINILYKGRKIYHNLTEEESTEILFELAQKFYDEQIDVNEIEIEEI